MKLLSSLMKHCHRNVHLEAATEELFHADWECARKKRKDWEDWADAFSFLLLLLLLLFYLLLLFSSSPHSRTLVVSKLAEVHSHLLPRLRAIVNSLQHPQRQEVEKRDGDGGGE